VKYSSLDAPRISRRISVAFAIVVVWFLCLGPSLVAQDSTRRIGTVTDSSLVVLRTQVATMREYQRDLLDTIHWSLGGIVTAALVLVTAGWFANFRVHSRDRDAILAELRGLTQQTLADSVASVRTESSKAEEKLDTKVHTLETSLLEKLESSHGALLKKLASLQVDFGNLIKEETEDREREIADLQVVNLEREAKEWVAKEVHSNVIRCCVKAVELSHKHDPLPQYTIPGFLDMILEAMNKHGRVDAEIARRLVSVLSQLPSEYSAVVARINSGLSGQV
jgi:hypothetical protein